MTDAAKDPRDTVSRKDSGMSGISISSPEVTAPIARDFAVPQTKAAKNIRHEKHDLPRTATNTSRPRPITAGSGKTVSFHSDEEMCGGMGRRFKAAMLTTFGGQKAQRV